MINFDTESKLRGCALFVCALRDAAGCSAEEIKRLLSPEMIDAYLSAKKQNKEGA